MTNLNLKIDGVEVVQGQTFHYAIIDDEINIPKRLPRKMKKQLKKYRATRKWHYLKITGQPMVFDEGKEVGNEY